MRAFDLPDFLVPMVSGEREGWQSFARVVMRQGVGAGQPYRGGHLATQPSATATAALTLSAHQKSQQTRTRIARLFIDLRRVMQITQHQAAAHFVTAVETFEALETGAVERLPPWPETARIVMAYTGLAGVDGRPVLAAIADEMRRTIEINATRAATVQNQRLTFQRPQVERLRQAGAAIANGARRLPKDAMQQVRERPERAFYAVSLPLGLLLILLNTSVLQAAFSHMPRPVTRFAVNVRQYFEVAFAPIHEGMRWIDVEDPRRRRGDKLR